MYDIFTNIPFPGQCRYYDRRRSCLGMVRPVTQRGRNFLKPSADRRTGLTDGGLARTRKGWKRSSQDDFVIVKVPCVFIKVLWKNCKNQKLTFQNQSTKAKSHQTKATWYCYSYFLNQVSFQKNRFGNSATTCFIGCHLSETEDAQMHCESARRERSHKVQFVWCLVQELAQTHDH